MHDDDDDDDDGRACVRTLGIAGAARDGRGGARAGAAAGRGGQAAAAAAEAADPVAAEAEVAAPPLAHGRAPGDAAQDGRRRRGGGGVHVLRARAAREADEDEHGEEEAQLRDAEALLEHDLWDAARCGAPV